MEPPGPPGEVGPTPLPVRLTRCRPEPSSPVISQLPVNGPRALGVNATPSVSVWPGATVVPSGSEVVGANAPPNGGLDFWIVTLVPPVLVIVNVLRGGAAERRRPEVQGLGGELEQAGQPRRRRDADLLVATRRVELDLIGELPDHGGVEREPDGDRVAWGDRVAGARRPAGTERRARDVDRVDRQVRAADIG